MELRLKLSGRSTFPPGGILVRGDSVEYWMKEIRRMELPLASITVYPLPGKTPNSVWGCLIEGAGERRGLDIGPHSFCQLAYGLVFIPEKTALYPGMSRAEAEQLFLSRKHAFHPEFGLVELPPAIRWEELIGLPEELPGGVRPPAPSVWVPQQVKSFQVSPLVAGQALEQMEQQYFPQQEELENRPLRPLEKVKLAFLKMFFHPSVAGRRLSDGEGGRPWMRRLHAAYEDLLERNKKQLGRLLDMLEGDPEQGLKYAIPLDESSLSRGPMAGSGNFSLSRRWGDLSLFGPGIRGGGRGGSAPLEGDDFQRLRNRYFEIAQELARKGDFRKAAFVYLKLLKNYPLAAQTLEQGELYAEAASVYLKYTRNKQKAAECYEKGSMFLEAIDLYKELNQDEKVGDLYLAINKREEARFYYEKVANRYRMNNQYVKAALLCRQKMGDIEAAQELLLQGWREDKDAFNCLNNYFVNIEDENAMAERLEYIYAGEVTGANRINFLRVIRNEFGRRSEVGRRIREIAHEIIVAEASRNPDILTELPHFNREDKQLPEDVMRFRVK